MAYAVADVVAEHELAAGDVLILNSPFRGGTHLPDVTLVAPVWADDGLVGYVANRAHHADIGGSAPGSMPLARHIDDEGVLIEPSLLFRAGELNEALLADIKSRVRTPAERDGDLRAQVAAARTGEARVLTLVERYGVAAVAEAFGALRSTAEQYMRAALRAIPDGRYEFEDRLDGDGVDEGTLPIRVALTVTDDRARVDFAGTAPFCRGNLNAPRSVTASAVLYAFRCLLPADCPSNDGLLAPIEVVVPDGCLLDARPPSAVAAGNVETSQRVVDVVLGALGRALPDRIPAASCGSMNNVAIGADSFAYYETVAGGAGAGPAADGTSAIHTHMTNTLNTPVESLESHYPLRLRRYAVRRGSGGAGRRRGGDGVVREVEALVPCRVSLLTERRVTAPYGAGGGEPGERGRNVLIRVDGSEVELPGKGVFDLAPGEALRLETPGGGGWGPSRP